MTPLTLHFTFSAKTSATGKRLGILLMDHGSRNEASNSRLKHLAHLYGTMIQDENIVVVAAHMEIASPSIPEGLEMLLGQGVGEYRLCVIILGIKCA